MPQDKGGSSPIAQAFLSNQPNAQGGMASPLPQIQQPQPLLSQARPPMPKPLGPMFAQHAQPQTGGMTGQQQGPFFIGTSGQGTPIYSQGVSQADAKKMQDAMPGWFNWGAAVKGGGNGGAS